MRYFSVRCFVVVAKSEADAGNCPTSSLFSDHMGISFGDTRNMSMKKNTRVNDGGWVDPKKGDAAQNWWLSLKTGHAPAKHIQERSILTE